MGPNSPRLGPGALISALNTGEFLRKSRNNVGRFRTHELLRRTGPRSAAKWNEIPQGLEPFPSLWTKRVSVLAPYVFVLVQAVDVEGYVFAFADEDGRLAVRTASGGKDGVVQDHSGVVV